MLKTLQGNWKDVDAAAIALRAQSMRIIPEKVKNEILDAKTQDDATFYLFQHLCSQATLADLRKLCSILKEADGYSKMNTFGKTLQTELDKVRWYITVANTTMPSGRKRMGPPYHNMFVYNAVEAHGYVTESKWGTS